MNNEISDCETCGCPEWCHTDGPCKGNWGPWVKMPDNTSSMSQTGCYCKEYINGLLDKVKIPIFTINRLEAFKAQKWRKEHDKICDHPYRKPMKGGHIEFAHSDMYAYCFGSCSIGDTVKIRCACGAKEDVTDVSSW